jgi:integrase
MVEGILLPDLEHRLAPGFAEHMRVTGKSEATIRIYSWAIDRFIKYAQDNDVVIVDRDVLLGWQDGLRHVKPRTAALAGVGMRRMLHWAADTERDHRYRELAFAVPTEKYERIKIRKTLTPATLRRLEYYLLEPKAASLKVRELRDRALFFYVKGTAARVSEILQVRRDRFNHDVVRQPGGALKAIIPPPGVIALLREYLAVRTDPLDCLWIAIRPDGRIGPLHDAGVLKIWERLARKVGVKPFTTRELRQTAGAVLVERGHDLVDVMAVMGLKDIRSVQGYQLTLEDRLTRVRADLDVVY